MYEDQTSSVQKSSKHKHSIDDATYITCLISYTVQYTILTLLQYMKIGVCCGGICCGYWGASWRILEIADGWNGVELLPQWERYF